MALLFEAYLAVGARHPRGAEAAARRMLALSQKHDFAYARDLANGVLGWALAHLGRPAEGVAMIRAAADGLLRSGGRLGHADVLTRLADAQDRAGSPMEALASIEAAISENPDGRTHLANALKYRGDLRLALSQPELAEADYQRSLAMAESLGARLMELRARTGLARILRARGEAAAGRDLLAPAVELLAPDFTGVDLDDARMLLGSLAA
jgi:tetratricopeptide (TPR) repeat protein